MNTISSHGVGILLCSEGQQDRRQRLAFWHLPSRTLVKAFQSKAFHILLFIDISKSYASYLIKYDWILDRINLFGFIILQKTLLFNSISVRQWDTVLNEFPPPPKKNEK